MLLAVVAGISGSRRASANSMIGIAVSLVLLPLHELGHVPATRVAGGIEALAVPDSAFVLECPTGIAMNRPADRIRTFPVEIER